MYIVTHCQGRTIGFCQGGAKYFKLRAKWAKFILAALTNLAPSVWGQSYNRGGQTFFTFIHNDLIICPKKHTGIK